MKATAWKFTLLILISVSSAASQNEIEMFIMDYPHGEYRVHVLKSGDAYLYYGERAEAERVRRNIFSVSEMYEMIKPYLHPSVPRGEWPNPLSQAGMVTIWYSDGDEVDYLIFDVQEVTAKIFGKAKHNIIEEHTRP